MRRRFEGSLLCHLLMGVRDKTWSATYDKKTLSQSRIYADIAHEGGDCTINIQGQRPAQKFLGAIFQFASERCVRPGEFEFGRQLQEHDRARIALMHWMPKARHTQSRGFGMGGDLLGCEA